MKLLPLIAIWKKSMDSCVCCMKFFCLFSVCITFWPMDLGKCHAVFHLLNISFPTGAVCSIGFQQTVNMNANKVNFDCILTIVPRRLNISWHFLFVWSGLSAPCGQQKRERGRFKGWGDCTAGGLLIISSSGEKQNKQNNRLMAV